jgi:hypothetical protein
VRHSLRGWLLIAGSLILTAALLAGILMLLKRLGLERADQLASVLALFIGIISLGASMLLSRQDRHPATPKIKTRRQLTAWGRRPLRDDVRRLLKTTQSVSNRSSNGLLGDRKNDVSVVYVQQRVEQPQAPGATATDRRLRRARFTGDAIFLPFDRRPKVIPVRRPLEHIFGQHRHLLIEGGPGTGKSTTAAQICRQLASAWLDAKEDGARLSALPLLPLLVTARALAEVAAQPWKDALATAAFRGLRLSSSEPVDPALLAGAVDGAEWLIVVDGLDEVPADEREKFLADLSRWTATTDEPYRLVITTRPLAAHATSMLGTGPIGHYTLLPFDRQMLNEFAQRWFSDIENGLELAAGFLTQVSSAGLQDVTSVPLMATIAITVYEADPHTRLPRNRHDLYEQYLRYLGRRDVDRRSAARAALVDDLRDEPNRAEVVVALFDQADELLEEVAIARVEGSRALALVGLDWLSRKAGLATGLARENWGERVAGALVGTGLLSHRDTGPDFIHLTFAEHFAARRHAAALPGQFDPQHAGWLQWVHRARRGDAVGMAVLTRWTRSHAVAGLLSWLLDAPSDYRLTAVRLVAEGTSPAEAHLAACLDAVDQKLWRTYADAEETLSPVRRFPQTVSVVQWLIHQLEGAPAGSTSWAVLAATLADRDRGRRPEIVANLLTAIDEGPLEGRFAAAKALTEVALEYRDTSASALTRKLESGGGSTSDRVAVASYLLEFDGEPRTAAVRVLEEILRDQSASYSARRTAAEALAEWDGDSRQVILGDLRNALNSPGYSDYERYSLAKAMIAVAPECRSEVAEWAKQVLRRPDFAFLIRVELLRTLADLGPDHRAIAVQRFKGFADDLAAAGEWQVSIAAARLAELGEEFWDDAINIVCQALLRLGSDPSSAGPPLHHLRDLDRELQERLMRAVVRMTEDPETPPGLAQRIRAATVDLAPEFQSDSDVVLAEHSGPAMTVSELETVVSRMEKGSPQCATQVELRAKEILTDPQTDIPSVISVAVCRSLEHRSATTTLFRIMTDSGAPAEARSDAASELLGRAEFRDDAASTMLALAHGPEKSQYWRHIVFRLLGQVTTYRQEAIRGLGVCMANSLLYTVDRVEAALALAEWEPERTPDVVAQLRKLLDARTNYPSEIEQIVRPLIRLTSDEHIRERLESLACDTCASGKTRAWAVEQVIELDRSISERYHAILKFVAVDRFAFARDRMAAICTLMRLGADHNVEVAQLAAEIARGELRPSAWGDADMFVKIYRQRDAVAAIFLQQQLIHNGFKFGNRASVGRMLSSLAFYRETVRAALSELVPTATSVAIAALILPWEHAAVAAAIRRIREAPGCPLPIQERVLQTQLNLTPEHRHSAIEYLIAVLSTPAQLGKIDSLVSAKLLYQVIAHRADAGAHLAAVLADETEALSRRWTARRVLAKDGGSRARRLAAASFVQDLRDARLPLNVRCRAAVEGVHAAPDTRAEAQDILRRLAGEPGEQAAILTALLEIDPGDGEALARLIALISDPATPHHLVATIASTLTRGPSSHRLACGTALESMLTRRLTAVRRVAFLGLLMDALPDTLPAVVKELAEIANDEDIPPAVRIRAASALCDADSGQIGRMGVEALLPILHNTQAHTHDRLAAGKVLLDTIGPHTLAVRKHLLAMTALEAAITVLNYDGDPAPFVLPNAPQPASGRVRDLMEQPGVQPNVLIRAAKALGEIDDPAHVAAAAATMRRCGQDVAVHPYLRTVALAEASCVNELWEILENTKAPLDYRRWAGEALVQCDERMRKPVRGALSALDGEHLDARGRRRLLRSVAYAETGQRQIA